MDSYDLFNYLVATDQLDDFLGYEEVVEENEEEINNDVTIEKQEVVNEESYEKN